MKEQNTQLQLLKIWLDSIREERAHCISAPQKEEYASMISYLQSIPLQDSYQVIIWRLEGVEYHKQMTLKNMQYYIKEGSLVLPDLESYGPSNLDHIDL
tara:strand:+ start:1406 stop:1702 length:297 start_codon:yes stop_codon:yes gene_type:complete